MTVADDSPSAVGPRPVAGLILAAGAGRRFGEPKALVALHDELFIERAVRVAVEGGCGPVVVVLGSAATEVIDGADLGTATVTVAEDWAQGLSASLQAGLAKLAATDAAAVVVTLVDQPWIGPESVVRLRDAWAAGAVAAVATYDGKARNPVILDRSVWADVSRSATGDTGARAWLRANPEQVVAVGCDGTGDPADVDTPADLTGHHRPDDGGQA
jgi:nicotine blue oxidoreductase